MATTKTRAPRRERPAEPAGPDLDLFDRGRQEWDRAVGLAYERVRLAYEAGEDGIHEDAALSRIISRQRILLREGPGILAAVCARFEGHARIDKGVPEAHQLRCDLVSQEWFGDGRPRLTSPEDFAGYRMVGRSMTGGGLRFRVPPDDAAALFLAMEDNKRAGRAISKRHAAHIRQRGQGLLSEEAERMLDAHLEEQIDLGMSAWTVAATGRALENRRRRSVE